MMGNSMASRTGVSRRYLALAAVLVMLAVTMAGTVSLADSSDAAKVTITYDPNDGTLTSVRWGNTQTHDNFQERTNNSGDITLKGVSFTDSNRTYTFSNGDREFRGWAESSSATAPDYTAGSSQNFSSATTLYAVWSFKATYYPNGGTVVETDANGTTQNVDSYTTCSGSDCTLTAPDDSFTSGGLEYVFTRSGHSFLGWTTDHESAVPEYTSGSTIVLTADTNLYAVWGYLVTFHPNGGTSTVRDTGGSDDPVSGRYYQNIAYAAASIYVPGESFCNDTMEYSYARTGYTFLGWAANSLATVPEYTEGNLLTVTGNITLYAVWAAENYNVVLHIGDTQMGYQLAFGSTLDTSTLENDVMSVLQGSERSIFAFVGWSSVVPEKVNLQSDNDPYYVYEIDRSDSDTDPVYSVLVRHKAAVLRAAEEAQEPYRLDLYPVYARIIDFSSLNSNLEIEDDGCYCLRGSTTSYSLTVSSGSPHLFLDGLVINFGSQTNSSSSPFTLTDGATTNVVVIGDSSFTGGRHDIEVSTGTGFFQNTTTYQLGYAGINVQDGTTFNLLEASTATLNATGGSVTTEGTQFFITFVNVVGKSGPGIGSNWDNSAEDGGCGTINVYGGTVVSTGGSSVVKAASGIISGTHIPTNDFVAAQGVGGEGSNINIEGGNVTAATGEVIGMNGNTVIEIGSEVGQDQDPIVAGNDEDDPYASPDADVTEIGREGSTIVAETMVTVTFTVLDGGNAVTISSAQTFTIDGIGLNVGGMEVSSSTTLNLPTDAIHVGSVISVTDSGNNYYQGTAVKTSDTSYRVDLTKQNTAYRGSVAVYTKEGDSQPVQATQQEGYFGMLNPYQSATVSYSESSLVYAFMISLNDNYTLADVLYRTDNEEWSSLQLDLDDYKSGSTYQVPVSLTLSNTNSTPSNDVCFQIARKTVEVGVTVDYSGSLTLPGAMVADASNASGITWETGYRSGTQTIYHGGNLTFTIRTAMGASNNPLFLELVTVNGESVEPVDNGDGTYTLVMENISGDKTVAVHYKDTVKVTLDQIDDPDGDSVRVCVTSFTDSAGNIVTAGVTDSGSQKYAYLKKGVNVYFVCEIDDSYDEEYGISYITLNSGADDESVLAYQTGRVYTLSGVTSDKTVTPEVTDLVHDIYLVSNGTEHYFKVPHESILAIPTPADIAELEGGDMVIQGSILTGWTTDPDFGEGDVPEYIVGGQPITVDVDLRLYAVWGERIQYAITYNLGGGTVDPANPEEYDVDDTVTLNNPVRTGYSFTGWTGTGLDSPTMNVSFSESTGDRSYTANWAAITVNVNFSDRAGFAGDGLITLPASLNLDYGEEYGRLPIYENQYKNSSTYVFAGWGILVDGEGDENDTVTKISSTTTVSTLGIVQQGNTYTITIVIIWIISGDYVINVDNPANSGGDVTAPFSCARGDTIIINITPDLGYSVGPIKIDGVTVYTPTVFEALDDGTCTYTIGQNDGFADLGNGTFTYTYTPEGNITVLVDFTPVVYTLTVYSGLSPYTAHSQDYTVESQNIYITSPYAPVADHDFLGWTTVQSSSVPTITVRIEVLTGSYGDKVFYEVWTGSVYSAVIIADSYTWNQGGSDFSGFGYRTIGMQQADLSDLVVSFTVIDMSTGQAMNSATEPGFYLIRITVSGYDTDRYNVTVYGGMLTVLENPHAQITIEPTAPSCSADPGTLNVNRAANSATSGTETNGVERATTIESPRSGSKDDDESAEPA